MTDPDPPLPYRQLSRLFGECYVSVGHATSTYLSRNSDRSVVALLVARMCAADWSVNDVLAPPTDPTRFCSINALSRSLGRPFETVRRHVHALAVEGLVSIDGRGVAIRPDAATRVVAFYTVAHDLLVRLIEDLDALGVLGRPRMPCATWPLSAMLGTALDIDLLPFETLRDTLGDWTSMALWSAISVVNVRHITTDAALAGEFATDYIPDRHRVPASLAMIARTLSIPYATAWRHAVELEKRDLMERQDRGWIVATRHFLMPGIAAGGKQGAHYGLRRIGELIAMGLDPADAPCRYMQGKPPLATFA